MMFDPYSLSYPRLLDGVVLNGPEDWPPAKLKALQRASQPADKQTEVVYPDPPRKKRTRRARS